MEEAYAIAQIIIQNQILLRQFLTNTEHSMQTSRQPHIKRSTIRRKTPFLKL